jgi:hypothetical protein
MAVFPSWACRLPKRNLAYKKNTKFPEQAEKIEEKWRGREKRAFGLPRPPGTGQATVGRDSLIRRQNWK